MYSIIPPSCKLLAIITVQTVLVNTIINSARLDGDFEQTWSLLSLLEGPWHSPVVRVKCSDENAVSRPRDEDEKIDRDRNSTLTSLFVERAWVSMTEVSWGKQFPTRGVRFLSPWRRETSSLSLEKPRQPCLRAGRAPNTSSERKQRTHTVRV